VSPYRALAEIIPDPVSLEEGLEALEGSLTTYLESTGLELTAIRICPIPPKWAWWSRVWHIVPKMLCVVVIRGTKYSSRMPIGTGVLRALITAWMYQRGYGVRVCVE
jgi:hypothetical protein